MKHDPALRNEASDYVADDKAALTCQKVLSLLPSILFPFCYRTPYPEMLNLNVVRMADALSAFFYLLSALVSLIFIITRTESHGFDSMPPVYIASSIITMLWVFLDKFTQFFGVPGMGAPKWMAFRFFGEQFIPVASTARRWQQLAFAFESVLCFDVVAITYLGAFGVSKQSTTIALFILKLFMSLFYSIGMAWGCFCPIWAFVGWLTKRGLVRSPRAEDTDQQWENSHSYFHDASPDGTISLRYGRFGPVVKLEAGDPSVIQVAPESEISPSDPRLQAWASDEPRITSRELPSAARLNL